MHSSRIGRHAFNQATARGRWAVCDNTHAVPQPRRSVAVGCRLPRPGLRGLRRCRGRTVPVSGKSFPRPARLRPDHHATLPRLWPTHSHLREKSQAAQQRRGNPQAQTLAPARSGNPNTPKAPRTARPLRCCHASHTTIVMPAALMSCRTRFVVTSRTSSYARRGPAASAASGHPDETLAVNHTDRHKRCPCTSPVR